MVLHATPLLERGRLSSVSVYHKGVEFTAAITYKTPFVVNGKLMTVFLDLGEGVACNTIFSCPFLKTIKASIMTGNNYLVSGILG